MAKKATQWGHRVQESPMIQYRGWYYKTCKFEVDDGQVFFQYMYGVNLDIMKGLNSYLLWNGKGGRKTKHKSGEFDTRDEAIEAAKKKIEEAIERHRNA